MLGLFALSDVVLYMKKSIKAINPLGLIAGWVFFCYMALAKIAVAFNK